MATDTRNPTSDIESSGTWLPTTNIYANVDDHPDSGTPPTDYAEHGTTAGYVTFGFSAFSLPSNASNISVAVKMYVYEATSGTNRLYGRLRVNSTGYNSSNYDNPTTTNALYTYTWSNNPASGSAWTYQEINGGGTYPLQGFGTYTSDANPKWRLASIQIEVTYQTGTTQYGQCAINDVSSITIVAQRVAYGKAAIDGYITVNTSGTKILIAACALDAISKLQAHPNVPTFSSYIENKLLDHLLKVNSFSQPTALYLSLHNGDPGETGANELSGSGYARASVAFSAASSGQSSNSAQVTFQEATGTWQVTHWGLWDAATIGNFICCGPLLAKTITSGTCAALSTGAVRVILD